MRRGAVGAGAALASLVLLSWLTGASAQGVAALPQGEFLFATPPDGWVIAHRADQRNQTIIEYVPAGQTVQNWTEMVTVQVWQGPQPALEPKAFIQTVAAHFRRVCKKLQASPTSVRQISGYENAFMTLECRDPDRSQSPTQILLRKIEYLVMRAIRGRDGFYVVQRAWHGDTAPPDAPMTSEAKKKEWGGFLARVEVCDTRDPALVCAILGLLTVAEADAFARHQAWAESDGCRYLRTLTVLPDMRKPIMAPVVAALAFGQGPLATNDAVRATVDKLAGSAADNHAVTVITNVSPAAGTSPAENAAKATLDTTVLRDLLVERGIAPARIVIRSNPSCRT